MADNDVGNIKEYCNVKAKPAIILPEVVMIKKAARSETTYPPLIVDGASGVGKTQQFFLLLGDGFHGAYVLPRWLSRPQEIYEEMESFTNMGELRRVLKESFAALQEEAKKDITRFPDPFSIATIRYFIKHSEVFVPAIGALASAIFKSDAGSESGLARVEKSGEDKSFLKGKVLFIDEVLSGSSLEDSKFLRFLRNFGRELGMRCVLAGTSATAANMICETHKGEGGSRSSEQSHVVWAVVCFLWKESSPTDVTSGDQRKQSLLKCLGDGRPLIEKIAKNCLEDKHPNFLEDSRQTMTKDKVVVLIRDVGKVIVDTKHPSEAASLYWAMGSWLDGEEKNHHAFRMKSASLIKNHFFEPAIRVVKPKSKQKSKQAVGGKGASEKGADKKHKAFTGWGLGTLERQSSPGYINIMRAQTQSNDPWWLISMTDKPVSRIPLKADHQEPLATCKVFKGVEYALTACVQQCVAREPLLALSLMATLEDLHTENDSFIKAVSESLQEERYSTSSSSQGGLNERLCMAALVVVSAKLGFETETPDLCTKAQQFTEALIDIMNPGHADFIPNAAFAKVSEKAPPPNPKKERENISPQFYVCHIKEENSATKNATLANEHEERKPSDGEEEQSPLATSLAALNLEADWEEEKSLATSSAEDGENNKEDDENNKADDENNKADDEKKKKKLDLDFVKADGEERRSLARDFADADMPLLVPACSKDRLAKSVALYPGLFEGLTVAGLVPGLANSRLDLSAHLLSDPEPAAWMFELRSRSNGYSVEEAARDLTEKVRGSKESCHAMLIGLKGEGPSDCWVWKNEKGKLNVAMVLVFPAY